jgi:hypothetical protein
MLGCAETIPVIACGELQAPGGRSDPAQAAGRCLASLRALSFSCLAQVFPGHGDGPRGLQATPHCFRKMNRRQVACRSRPKSTDASPGTSLKPTCQSSIEIPCQPIGTATTFVRRDLGRWPPAFCHRDTTGPPQAILKKQESGAGNQRFTVGREPCAAVRNNRETRCKR